MRGLHSSKKMLPDIHEKRAEHYLVLLFRSEQITEELSVTLAKAFVSTGTCYVEVRLQAADYLYLFGLCWYHQPAVLCKLHIYSMRDNRREGRKKMSHTEPVIILKQSSAFRRRRQISTLEFEAVSGWIYPPDRKKRLWEDDLTLSEWLDSDFLWGHLSGSCGVRWKSGNMRP